MQAGAKTRAGGCGLHTAARVAALRWLQIGLVPGLVPGLALALGLALSLAPQAAAAEAGTAGEVLVVGPGDSFSALAGRFTGNPRAWRRLYRPHDSGLPDPSRVEPGMRLQLVADSWGGQYLKLLLPAAAPAPLTAGLPAPAPLPARDDSLVLGVLPNIDPALLVQHYDLLRRYLEHAGAARQVRVVVPASFQAFFDATLRGDFDLAVAAPHLARVAQLDRGLVPLLSYEPRTDALLLAPVGSALASAADLAGLPVAFAHPQSLVALYGLQWFERQGLVPNRDFQVKAARSELGVGRMVLVGEAAAAVMSQGEFRALPPAERGRLRIVAELASMPNFIVLAHPRLGLARQARLRQLLKGFLADPAQGAEFARHSGLIAIVDASEGTLRELDPFVVTTRQVMGR